MEENKKSNTGTIVKSEENFVAKEENQDILGVKIIGRGCMG